MRCLSLFCAVFEVGSWGKERTYKRSYVLSNSYVLICALVCARQGATHMIGNWSKNKGLPSGTSSWSWKNSFICFVIFFCNCITQKLFLFVSVMVNVWEHFDNGKYTIHRETKRLARSWTLEPGARVSYSYSHSLATWQCPVQCQVWRGGQGRQGRPALLVRATAFLAC